MKKFLLNSALFIVLFFIAEKGMYYFLQKAPDREYDKRLEHLINGEMNKDLFVFGSSRGGGNILAEQIEKETGYSSYNLSYQGANIIYQNFILKYLRSILDTIVCIRYRNIIILIMNLSRRMKEA